jgi:hypothetical protein
MRDYLVSSPSNSDNKTNRPWKFRIPLFSLLPFVSKAYIMGSVMDQIPFRRKCLNLRHEWIRHVIVATELEILIDCKLNQGLDVKI